MQLIFNNTLHIITHGKNELLPGTNIVEEFDAEHPIIKAMLENGKLEIYDQKTVTEEVKIRAVAKSTTNTILLRLEKDFKVKAEATKERKKLIADYNKEVDEALKNEGKKED